MKVLCPNCDSDVIPVSVGDTVYRVYPDVIIATVVETIEINSDGIILQCKDADADNCYSRHMLDRFGETLFSTRGQAEAALKRMG